MLSIDLESRQNRVKRQLSSHCIWKLFQTKWHRNVKMYKWQKTMGMLVVMDVKVRVRHYLKSQFEGEVRVSGGRQ